MKISTLKHTTWTLTALLAVSLALPACQKTSSPAEASQKAPITAADIIFTDNFNRSDSKDIGNGWVLNATNEGTAYIKDKAISFEPADEEFEPRVEHKFATQTKGKFSVSFKMDWVRDFENTWGLYIQLGNSKNIPKELEDLSKGISVNVAWGGSDVIEMDEVGVLGFFKDAKFSKLAIINDGEVKESVLKDSTIIIEVDMDSSSYTLSVNGKTYDNLPFDNEGPIDTIRFVAHLCNPSNFTKSSIDDVKVFKTK